VFPKEKKKGRKRNAQNGNGSLVGSQNGSSRATLQGDGVKGGVSHVTGEVAHESEVEKKKEATL